MKRFFPLLLAMAVLLPSVSHALVTKCVANATQLVQALNEAAASSDLTFRIRLRSGTYAATPQTGLFHARTLHDNQVLEISGGWNGANGACTSMNPDPSKTLIIGGQEFSALTLSAGPGSVSGSTLWAHGLTVSNPDSIVGVGAGGVEKSACLRAGVRSNNELRIERMQIKNCIAPWGWNASGYLTNYGGYLLMRNVLVQDGDAVYNGGMTLMTRGGLSEVNQITITRTQSRHNLQPSGLVLDAHNGGGISLGNALIWGNSNTGDAPLTATSTGCSGCPSPSTPGVIDLYRVNATNVSRQGPGSAAGITSVDPKFIAAGNPRLRFDSPLVNGGWAAPEGGVGNQDADGKARVVGVLVDVGAFEYAPTQPPSLTAPPSISVNVPTLVPNSLLYTVQASDSDGPYPLSYSVNVMLVNDNPPPPVAVNSAGEVRLTSALPAMAQWAKLRVRVTDGEAATTRDTEVFFNRAPTIANSNGQVQFPSDSAVGMPLFQFGATDDFSQTLYWSIQSVQSTPAGLPNPISVSDDWLHLAQAFPQNQNATYVVQVRVCDSDVPALALCANATVTVTSTQVIPPEPLPDAIFSDDFE